MNREALMQAIAEEEKRIALYDLPDWMATETVLRLLTDTDAMSLLRSVTSNGLEPAALLSLMSRRRFDDLLNEAEEFANHKLRGERLMRLFPSAKSLPIEEMHVRYENLLHAAQACGVIEIARTALADGTPQLRLLHLV
jgi:hypothetical protein